MINFIKKLFNLKGTSSSEDFNIPDPDSLGLIPSFTPPEGEEYSGDR
jgi:hypothetical protein